MGAVTPGETLGTLYNIHVGSNKTKQHIIMMEPRVQSHGGGGGVARDGGERRMGAVTSGETLGTLHSIARRL